MAMSSGATGSVSDDKQQLLDILQQDEYAVYHHEHSGSSWGWLGKLLNKIGSWLPELHFAPGSGQLGSYVVLLIVLGLAGFGIYWFSRRWVGYRRHRATALWRQEEPSRSYEDYWRQAAELAAAGAWREGLRQVYLALLFYLEAQGRLRVETWKTNWEYAAELGSAPEATLFRESSLLFDRVWYGHEEATEERLLALREQVGGLLDKGGGQR
ncbi:DUF4129 domain-containing protein [Paenibacillus athensensis]|uniref:Protein-glutamine gamma-glutamyltransferase-like C-terminal domain-containing protein n=1 Tax=Paenibacillus athensensis TaxID=1967502 RepID=A0A4Y8Q040_9BACL|nr:DUF4129 domain-containing protein [Paenibacillus athensensis]MCD1261111.1 DUF4129 domain-containing protein [Paenibacillus athensensis]